MRQSFLSGQLAITGPDPATLRTERRKKVEKNHETDMTMTMKVPIWMYARTRVGRRQAPAERDREDDFIDYSDLYRVVHQVVLYVLLTSN